MLTNEQKREFIKSICKKYLGEPKNEEFQIARKEKILEETVLKIYNFSQSFPWPQEWLQDRYEDC